MDVKIVGIASDHAGYALKQFVKKYLEEKGYEFKDYGTYTEDSCDYSDFGHALAEGIEKGEVFPGMADAPSYLTFKFGDYKSLPPVEKRKVHPVTAIKLVKAVLRR